MAFTRMVKAHELEDDAKEVVDVKPRRRSPRPASVEEAVTSAVGGRMEAMRAKAAETKDDFISIRGPLGAAKVYLDHLTVFDAVWRVWAGKRASGINPGVAVSEVHAKTDKPLSSVREILHTLVQNGLIRSVRKSVGTAGLRAFYYPTEIGTQLLSVAQTFGGPTMIQIGGNAAAWRNRSDDEPSNFFEHAALLSGKAL